MAKKTTPNSTPAPTDARAQADARRAARRTSKATKVKSTASKASPTQIKALAPLVDPKTLAYVDERLTQIVHDQYVNIEILQSKIKELRTQLIHTQELLTKMAEKEGAALNPTQPDDRYLLTRAKLIKLMKHLGYS